MFSKIKSFMTTFITGRKFCISVLAVLSATVITFVGISVNAVHVADGDDVHTLYSLATRPVDIRPLSDSVFTNLAKDRIDDSVQKINLNVDSDIPVHVTMGNETVTVFVSRGQTVQDAIDLSGFSLDEHDSVNLSLLSSIVETDYIDIIDINYVTEIVEETIPFETKTVYSKKLDSISSKGGEEGLKELTCLTKLVNGVATERDVIKETVLKDAVDQVITVGMKNGTSSSFVECISTIKPATPIRLDVNGVPVRYKKHVTVQATAYTYTGNNCASGVAPQPGCVAVNTNIFPFGTKFYIKSSDGKYIYGYAVAADTGGFLKTRPTNFDLFFETEAQCKAFGRRNIEVYVLY